jgi:REP element-mobilizing transposase RayT
MARRLRYIPEGHMVEVTARTIQGRHLLLPTPELTDIILGVLGRAQARFSMVIHAFVFLSNHFHMLLSPVSAKQLADFMCFVNGNVAKEAGKLAGWKAKFWGRRYQAIVVSNEEAAQIGRLNYLLANGCKEGLVARPQDWTGASTASALLNGDQFLTGHWFDRTLEYRARKAGKSETYDSLETVTLTPLPCWTHLEELDRQQQVGALVQQIEEDTARMHQENGTSPLGMDRVLLQDPHGYPEDFERSPAPLFHAATKKGRLLLREAYDTFLMNYRWAAERLKAGDLYVCFPSGSFPPPRPYVEGFAFG